MDKVSSHSELVIKHSYAALTGWVLVLFAGTLMPGSLKTGIEQQMWHVLPWSAMAHLVLFGVIAAQPAFGRGWGAVARALLLAAVLACTTELLQTWVPGRHPRLQDVGIDLAGALVGLALRQVLLMWMGRRAGAP